MMEDKSNIKIEKSLGKYSKCNICLNANRVYDVKGKDQFVLSICAKCMNKLGKFHKTIK